MTKIHQFLSDFHSDWSLNFQHFLMLQTHQSYTFAHCNISWVFLVSWWVHLAQWSAPTQSNTGLPMILHKGKSNSLTLSLLLVSLSASIYLLPETDCKFSKGEREVTVHGDEQSARPIITSPSTVVHVDVISTRDCSVRYGMLVPIHSAPAGWKGGGAGHYLETQYIPIPASPAPLVAFQIQRFCTLHSDT